MISIKLTNMKKEVTRTELKKALLNATGCDIQHDGWTCGTCFFAISEKMTNKDWQAVLLTRGDYKEWELDNLPRNIQKSLKKVVKLADKY